MGWAWWRLDRIYVAYLYLVLHNGVPGPAKLVVDCQAACHASCIGISLKCCNEAVHV